MLRINLLPPYIYDKQKKVRLALLMGALVAAAVGIFLVWFVSLNTALGAQKDQQQKAETFRTQYTSTDGQISSEKTRRAEIEKRQTFIADAQALNDAWPAAFETMRDVTANNILLKSMSIDKDRKTVNMTGFAKTEDDIVRWWEYLRNNYAGPDASLPFDNVVLGLPGHPYPPKDSANGGAGGQKGAGFGGSGGFGGSPMGMPSAAGASSAGGGPSSGGGGGGRSGPGGAGGNDTKVGPGVVEGRPGINFTASITLKKPIVKTIATPVWSAGGAPPAPSGFGGGPSSGGSGSGGRTGN